MLILQELWEHFGVCAIAFTQSPTEAEPLVMRYQAGAWLREREGEEVERKFLLNH